MPLLEETPYTADDVPDYPQCSPQPLKVVHVGAGASGILFAYKAQLILENYELVCYEKNDTIDGTWFENRYPGCACDVPAHTYVYPFDPNPEWSGYYSYADEIQRYLVNFSKRHDCEKYVQFNTEVMGATWDETDGLWKIELKRADGTTFSDTANVLVNGSLHDFKGTLAHSAAWDSSLDWKDKKVGVIGAGSSSIQIVPQIAASASHLSVFIRNQMYIGPQMGLGVSNKEADPDAADPSAAGKHKYTEKEKERFRRDPEYFLQYRQQVERKLSGLFWIFYRSSEENLAAKKHMQELMSAELGVREDIKKALIPNWSPGCRRYTPGEGHLAALQKDNVTPVFNPILKVVPEGIMTVDGTTHKLNILICATGLHVAFIPHFRLTGLGGQVMQDQTDPNIYGAIAVPGFPNYFIVNGPRGNWGQGCVLPAHETQIDYILQACRKMQQDGIQSMVPRQDITSQFNQYLDAWHNKNSVWTENCRSWYKDNKPDGRVYLWSGSMHHHLKFLKRPRYEHYDIKYNAPGNIFSFLGNGVTITEVKYKGNPDALPVPYIRNNVQDQWDIE
ncbi:FAD/NAD(P)-binding domain-containing protein [Tothia fuscella]|uniref:FAD/NAD(P)-binding domain-containing protein n=1 Tax=Tothia fuscella TaxID=1048955 RepID=A0A9P4TZZ7_9PEZI|nr:FAD/NAD(P)-binding domain-containing protein [Tothia fuscella]